MVAADRQPVAEQVAKAVGQPVAVATHERERLRIALGGQQRVHQQRPGGVLALGRRRGRRARSARDHLDLVVGGRERALRGGDLDQLAAVRRRAQLEPDEPVLGLGPPGAVAIGGGVERAGEPAQQVAELERVEATELIEPQRPGAGEAPLRPAQLLSARARAGPRAPGAPSCGRAAPMRAPGAGRRARRGGTASPRPAPAPPATTTRWRGSARGRPRAPRSGEAGRGRTPPRTGRGSRRRSRRDRTAAPARGTRRRGRRAASGGRSDAGRTG